MIKQKTASGTVIVILAIAIVAVLILTVGGLFLFKKNPATDNNQIINPNLNEQSSNNLATNYAEKTGGLLKFNSFSEFKNFLKSASTNVQSQANVLAESAVSKAAALSSDSAGVSATRYSHTNVQVEGVDEPDIMKNDGKYIYTLSGNTIKIIEAFPASNMKLLGEIKYENKIINYNEPYTTNYVRNIFINQDKLVVFVNSYSYTPPSSIQCLGLYYCSGESETKALIHVYDLTDKTNPKLEQSIALNGDYYDARMIKDNVYFISRAYINPDEPELPVYYINNVEKIIPIDNIFYFNYEDNSYYMTSLSSLNVKSGEFSTKSYVIGYSSTIYASENNIYVTNSEYMKNDEYQKSLITEAVIPIVPDSEKQKINDLLDSNKYEYTKWRKIGKIVEDYYNTLPENEKSVFNQSLFNNLFNSKVKLEKEREKTVVNKFSITNGNIEYKASGKVPGRILNQFSMDESNDYFRIATTVGNRWWWGWWNSERQINSSNGAYVLDSNMNLVGKVEDLASGETIYSTRFVGKRLYMVTYRRVDPFFVIDLSNPKNPQVLGYLKIPGASEYLHPYDENHIIGIGNDADEEGRTKGLKISLFDVTNPLNPQETARYTIGDRGTRSPVLDDHKALLFDKENNLMVFPVTVYEIKPDKYGNNVPEWAYGDAVYQGAYIFNINTEKIELKGKITHFTPYVPVYPPASAEPVGVIRYDTSGWSYTKIGNDQWKPNQYFRGYYSSDLRIDELPGGVDFHPNFYDSRYTIKRSLFMDNSLYTVSNSQVKANDLNTLTDQKSIDLGYVENTNYHWYY